MTARKRAGYGPDRTADQGEFTVTQGQADTLADLRPAEAVCCAVAETLAAARPGVGLIDH